MLGLSTSIYICEISFFAIKQLASACLGRKGTKHLLNLFPGKLERLREKKKFFFLNFYFYFPEMLSRNVLLHVWSKESSLLEQVFDQKFGGREFTPPHNSSMDISWSCVAVPTWN